jgi:hypothetical protein
MFRVRVRVMVRVRVRVRVRVLVHLLLEPRGDGSVGEAVHEQVALRVLRQLLPRHKEGRERREGDRGHRRPADAQHQRPRAADAVHDRAPVLRAAVECRHVGLGLGLGLGLG